MSMNATTAPLLHPAPLLLLILLQLGALLLLLVVLEPRACASLLADIKRTL